MVMLGRETSNSQYEKGSALLQEHAHDAQRPVPSTAPRRAFHHFSEKTPVREKMVPLGRIELPASPLPMVRSTTELQRLTKNQTNNIVF